MKKAFTIIELLVVVTTVAILLALLLPAVQAARESARVTDCRNRIRQLSLALHSFHDSKRSLPPGQESGAGSNRHPYQTWLAKLLPYLGDVALSGQIDESYQSSSNPFDSVVHNKFATPVRHFVCPSDDRGMWMQISRGIPVAITDFVGVSGVNHSIRDGCLFVDSSTRFAEIQDGLSNTFVIAERPASFDSFFGWWYAGSASRQNGAFDSLLGSHELNPFDVTSTISNCSKGPYRFMHATVQEPCNVFHYWSLHGNGANFALGDSSIRFINYSVDSEIMKSMSTRAGGESRSGEH